MKVVRLSAHALAALSPQEIFLVLIASRIRTELRPDPARKLSANLNDIYHCCVCVQRKTPDDGQRDCPKHVEVYSKNKFEKLVHLVGFIIRIYHDARSHERQSTVSNKSRFKSSGKDMVQSRIASFCVILSTNIKSVTIYFSLFLPFSGQSNIYV